MSTTNRLSQADSFKICKWLESHKAKVESDPAYKDAAVISLIREECKLTISRQQLNAHCEIVGVRRQRDPNRIAGISAMHERMNLLAEGILTLHAAMVRCGFEGTDPAEPLKSAVFAQLRKD